MNQEKIVEWTRQAGGFDATPEFLKRFAAAVLANNPPQSSMAWQEGFEVGRAERDKELQLLRELAAGQCTIRKVIDELGPMSLWSNAAFEKKLDEAKAEEREACAKVCEAYTDNDGGKFIDHEGHGYECAAAIRARGQA